MLAVAIDKRPVAAAVGVALGVVELAQAARFHQALRGFGLWLIQRSQLDVQHLAGALGRFVHRFRTCIRPRHGLFTVGILTRLQHIDGYSGVQEVVQADIDRVEIVTG